MRKKYFSIFCQFIYSFQDKEQLFGPVLEENLNSPKNAIFKEEKKISLWALEKILQ